MVSESLGGNYCGNWLNSKFVGKEFFFFFGNGHSVLCVKSSCRTILPAVKVLLGVQVVLRKE